MILAKAKSKGLSISMEFSTDIIYDILLGPKKCFCFKYLAGLAIKIAPLGE